MNTLEGEILTPEILGRRRMKPFRFHTFIEDQLKDERIDADVRNGMMLHNIDHRTLKSIGSASKAAEVIPGMDGAEIGSDYLKWVKNVKASNNSLPKEFQQNHHDL